MATRKVNMTIDNKTSEVITVTNYAMSSGTTYPIKPHSINGESNGTIKAENTVTSEFHGSYDLHFPGSGYFHADYNFEMKRIVVTAHNVSGVAYSHLEMDMKGNVIDVMIQFKEL